ncbi:MAG: prepilin-type N-terminal cleavage/methylation domain-containing protein [Planctomycetota bacterium]|jgi:prepilin-type N-terminal cleavage/methylation domain-containing protein
MNIRLALYRSCLQAAARQSDKRGFSLLEVMIAMTILTVCCGMLTSTITGTMQHKRINRERQIAVEAARAVIEDLHNVDFYDAYWTYNQDGTDDEGGEGTAPGSHFAVPGLDPVDGDLDGFVGEILLPGKTAVLLENAENAMLGLPRDLNGDLIIDERDHSSDYLILPVVVKINWKSGKRTHEFKLCTMLADIRKTE